MTVDHVNIIALINQAEATQVIAKYEGVMIRANVFDSFIAACDEAKVPNKALLEAMAFTKQGEFKRVTSRCLNNWINDNTIEHVDGSIIKPTD